MPLLCCLCLNLKRTNVFLYIVFEEDAKFQGNVTGAVLLRWNVSEPLIRYQFLGSDSAQVQTRKRQIMWALVITAKLMAKGLKATQQKTTTFVLFQLRLAIGFDVGILPIYRCSIFQTEDWSRDTAANSCHCGKRERKPIREKWVLTQWIVI